MPPSRRPAAGLMRYYRGVLPIPGAQIPTLDALQIHHAEL